MFDRLGHRQLLPAWTYIAGGAIWRLAPGDAGTLVGEARDLQKKQATFFCLDRDTGVPRWEGLSCAGGWWVGIETIHEGVLLVHGFASPDLPRHRGLTAIDVRSGTLLWMADEIEFVGAGGDAVFGIRTLPGGTEAVRCNIRSGVQTAVDTADEPAAPLMISRTAADHGGDFQLPVPISIADDSTGVRELLSRHIPIDTPELLVERLDCGTSLVIAVHEQADAREDGHAACRTRLLVIDRTSGDLRLDELLNAGMGVPVDSSFMVLDGTLYALKGRNTLLAYSL